MLSQKRSPRWAFFRRLDIANPETGEVYLRRLRLIEAPWFGVYLHRINGPDFGRDLHDHPWPFIALVLIGGYIEEVAYGRTRVVSWLNRKRAQDSHRIVTLFREPTWTLVFHGRRCREWGFHTSRGWVQWDEYERLGSVTR